MLMSLYSVIKFSILSPINVMNRVPMTLPSGLRTSFFTNTLKDFSYFNAFSTLKQLKGTYIFNSS